MMNAKKLSRKKQFGLRILFFFVVMVVVVSIEWFSIARFILLTSLDQTTAYLPFVLYREDEIAKNKLYLKLFPLQRSKRTRTKTKTIAIEQFTYEMNSR